jgi:hypothetical protein
LAVATSPPTPADDLGEELRVFLKQLERSVGDGPVPFAGRSTAALRDQLRGDADRLDDILGAYLAAAK